MMATPFNFGKEFIPPSKNAERFNWLPDISDKGHSIKIGGK
jgi:hypothetical protein